MFTNKKSKILNTFLILCLTLWGSTYSTGTLSAAGAGAPAEMFVVAYPDDDTQKNIHAKVSKSNDGTGEAFDLIPQENLHMSMAPVEIPGRYVVHADGRHFELNKDIERKLCKMLEKLYPETFTVIDYRPDFGNHGVLELDREGHADQVMPLLQDRPHISVIRHDHKPVRTQLGRVLKRVTEIPGTTAKFNKMCVTRTDHDGIKKLACATLSKCKIPTEE